MATPAMDPKSALLADDLKEFALTLPTTTFPKNFFCALCNSLAFDSWKLLCCNKSICSPCQAKLEFPTTCPSCDHTPLESDSCSPNKSLRNTMRVWLQKQKKKEEAKAVSQAATPTVEAPPAAPEVQPTSESANKPAEEHATNVEAATGDQDLAAAHVAEQTTQRAGSTASQMNEDSTSQNDSARRDSNASQALNKGAEPQIAEDAPDAQGNMNGTGDMFGNNAMINMSGMQGQFGYGFNPNQGNFNGMGWNGMGPMNGMQNMMGNGNWNGMNPMDFNMNNNMNGMSNMPNGMYGGNFSGNMGMGMGMNDMSMNMNYGGGYGSGWNGMGGGYGNFNGFNQMGGYNQSGAYPEMNQFPKNNFPNQNRFHANGGAPPQRNSRKGSQGGFGPGSGLQNNANSRPESRNGPQQSRDGELPEGDADAAVHEVVVENEQAKTSTEPTDEGKESTETAAAESTLSEAAASGAVSNDVDNLTQDSGNEAEGVNQSSGLKQIQTVDSGEPDLSNFDQPMMNNVMQPNMPYSQGMMNQFQQQGAHMNGPYNPNMNMNMNMGYNQNNYGLRGGNGSSGFNAAYGAATVLTGEPRGLGVEGAPTGPRAMREGRPNTGFSSRANNARFNPPPKSVTPAQETAPASPPRRVRSRSPQRDDSLRTKDKSPSRSRSGSRARGDDRHEYRDRSRSVDREDRQEERGPSPRAREDDEPECRKERRHHRSSRYDDRDDDYDDRRREDRDDRGDRTRSASADSKYRSRRDKEKHRSSRSHRDRSREHRRRHRSRSRSAAGDKYEDDDGYTNGDQHSESGSRRKHRSEKDKYRERERDRSRDRERDRDRRDRKERDRERDRDRDRDREYEHDYEREKDRSREKDRDRKRRRDREAEEDDRDYEDDKYRSSRRSRKERERDRERDRDRDYDKEPSSATSARPPSPPLNAPTGPSANGFSIKGRSKNTMAPPSGPRTLQPPTGPAADREKERRDSRDHRRKSSVSSIPSAPATPTTQDHYAAERERNARERDRLDRDNRDTLVKNIHARVTSRPSLSSKRSRDDFESSNAPSESAAQDRPIKAPTGPSAHRDKRRKSGGDDNIAKLFAAGLRKSAGKSARRGGVRTEGDGERDLERVERERDRR